MKKKTIITLKTIITVLLVAPVVIFAFNVFSRPRPVPEVRDVQKIRSYYKIASRKEGPFDKKVKRLFVITKVDTSLMPGFGRHLSTAWYTLCN